MSDEPQARGTDPFIGEIGIVTFNYAPRGWAMCDGQLLPIFPDNQALFSLIGTTYGGNGTNSFRLPDLRGRVPLHVSALAAKDGPPGLGQFLIGQTGGVETVTLSTAEMPRHTHRLAASDQNGTTTKPANAYPASVYDAQQVTSLGAYSSEHDTWLAADMAEPVGGSQPHSNLQPYLTLNFIIALEGIFPTRP
jgi:microcystin-dependent protein